MKLYRLQILDHQFDLRLQCRIFNLDDILRSENALEDDSTMKERDEK